MMTSLSVEPMMNEALLCVLFRRTDERFSQPFDQTRSFFRDIILHMVSTWPLRKGKKRWRSSARKPRLMISSSRRRCGRGSRTKSRTPWSLDPRCHPHERGRRTKLPGAIITIHCSIAKDNVNEHRSDMTCSFRSSLAELQC